MCVLFAWTVCVWSLLRQLFPSRCSIPVTQLQTGPVVLLLQICSQPPLLSSHQSASKESSQVRKSHQKILQKLWNLTEWLRKALEKWTQTALFVSLKQLINLEEIVFLHMCNLEILKVKKSSRTAERVLRPPLPLLLMGPTLNMCSLWSLSSEYILLLCGQFWMDSTHTLIQQPLFYRQFYSRWRFFLPLCRRLFQSRTETRHSGGGLHRNPQWTWRRWHGSDRLVTHRSPPCRWCCP